MGCCFSSDSTPDIPTNVRPDPPTNAPLTVVIRRLGTFWGRDYSIHEGTKYPSSSDEAKNTMWLWLNKRDGSSPQEVFIDVENFVRNKPDNPKQGQVLYTARFNPHPTFDQFSRRVGTSFEAYLGFFNEGWPTNDDFYYLNNKAHTSKLPAGGRRLEPQIVTKFRFNTQAILRDGDIGRAADIFQHQDVTLDIFSTGTAVTTFDETEREVEDRNDKGEVTGRHKETTMHKIETTFVDRVEYRLIFKGQLWGQWWVPGDAAGPTGDLKLVTPFFNTNMVGGWFKPNEYIVSTLPGVDGAFAILLSHLCCTEYSVANIKADFQPNTPTMVTSFFTEGFSNGMGPNLVDVMPVNGTFVAQQW